MPEGREGANLGLGEDGRQEVNVVYLAQVARYQCAYGMSCSEMGYAAQCKA